MCLWHSSLGLLRSGEQKTRFDGRSCQWSAEIWRDNLFNSLICFIFSILSGRSRVIEISKLAENPLATAESEMLAEFDSNSFEGNLQNVN